MPSFPTKSRGILAFLSVNPSRAKLSLIGFLSLMGYNGFMKYQVITTTLFSKWLSKLKDRQAVKAIALRIARAEMGNLGDTQPVGEGVSEMRIFVGKGYRIYFAIRQERVIVLINGGIKSNKKQQQADIALAQKMLRELEKKA